MSICIEKLPHSCGTRQGLQVFLNEETGYFNGFCFACNTPVPNPYGLPKTAEEMKLPEPKSLEEVQKELDEIVSYPTVDIKSRRLRATSLEFDIKFLSLRKTARHQ